MTLGHMTTNLNFFLENGDIHVNNIGSKLMTSKQNLPRLRSFEKF